MSISIDIGIGIGIGISISLGISSIGISIIGISIDMVLISVSVLDSFLQSFYCLKLTGTDRQAGIQACRWKDKPVYCVLGGCASKKTLVFAKAWLW